MITLEQVKETVERVYNETALEPILDISIKSRKRDLVDLRFTYFAICKALSKELKKPSLERIGKEVDRDHASVIYGLKEFEHLYGKAGFSGNDIYSACINILAEHAGEGLSEGAEKQQIIAYYRVQQIKMSAKYREVIVELQNKLKNYRTNPLVDEVAGLDKEDIKELEMKLEVFFKVKKSLKIAS